VTDVNRTRFVTRAIVPSTSEVDTSGSTRAYSELLFLRLCHALDAKTRLMRLGKRPLSAKLQAFNNPAAD
jgi:hypothetical protein